VRIKKDKTSWRASSIITRDKRHDKSFDGSSGPIKKKKKNTKKWCKGIEGRQHNLVYREWIKAKSWKRGDSLMEVACENCDKSFDIDWPDRIFDGKTKGEEVMLSEWNKKLGIE